MKSVPFQDACRYAGKEEKIIFIYLFLKDARNSLRSSKLSTGISKGSYYAELRAGNFQVSEEFMHSIVERIRVQ